MVLIALSLLIETTTAAMAAGDFPGSALGKARGLTTPALALFCNIFRRRHGAVGETALGFPANPCSCWATQDNNCCCNDLAVTATRD